MKNVAAEEPKDLESAPVLVLVEFLKNHGDVAQLDLEGSRFQLAEEASRNRCWLLSARTQLDVWCTSSGYRSSHHHTAVQGW
jgi:hypothetical protein